MYGQQLLSWVSYSQFIKSLKAEPDPFEEPKRARNKKGEYVGDDKSTPKVNEAWEGGKKPKRGRGRPKGSKNKPKTKKNV